MLWKRWLTALLLIPPLVILILKGTPPLFAAAVGAVALLSLWEYFRIVYHGHEPKVTAPVMVWTYLCAGMMIVAIYHQQPMGLMAVLAVNLLGAAIISIFRFKISQDAPVVTLKAVFGLVYIPMLLAFLIPLRLGTNGPLWVLFLLWVVAWGDTGALYTGTYLGRHKLCPAVSPKKTIEGALGGLAANVVFGLLFKILFFNGMNGITCIVLALAAGAMGQAGDLFESEFKRAAGVKDSSNLLPGHGGLLDRLDALFFAAPVGYLLKEYLLP